MKNNKLALSAMSIAVSMMLVACGGGGGSSDGSAAQTNTSGTGSAASSPQTVTGTQATPQYPATSAQLAALNLLNQYRQQCGFPALQENTVLDTAAQNHAKYMGLSNGVSDTESEGSQGYTGVSYLARAAAVGFPSNAFGLGVSGAGNSVFSTDFSASQAGEQFVYALLGGVYHADIAAYPISVVGIGEYETQVSSGAYTFTNSWQSMSLLNTEYTALANSPATFPCQGVTGLPYREVSEIPTPPNVSNSGWGTPVVVMGNTNDTIELTSGTMTDTSGNMITLQLLSAKTDPNKELAAYQAVAYPTSPLSPNTQYSVSLVGTANGKSFSRTFTFTTGNIIG